MRTWIPIVAALASLACAAACAGGAGPAARSVPLLPAARQPGSSPYVRHVVIMIQENRSFDDFFADFPGADGATGGYMKTPHGDVWVTLKAGSLRSDSLGHQHFAFEKEYDRGKMDGFNLVDRALHRG